MQIQFDMIIEFGKIRELGDIREFRHDLPTLSHQSILHFEEALCLTIMANGDRLYISTPINVVEQVLDLTFSVDSKASLYQIMTARGLVESGGKTFDIKKSEEGFDEMKDRFQKVAQTYAVTLFDANVRNRSSEIDSALSKIEGFFEKAKKVYEARAVIENNQYFIDKSPYYKYDANTMKPVEMLELTDDILLTFISYMDKNKNVLYLFSQFQIFEKEYRQEVTRFINAHCAALIYSQSGRFILSRFFSDLAKENKFKIKAEVMGIDEKEDSLSLLRYQLRQIGRESLKMIDPFTARLMIPYLVKCDTFEDPLIEHLYQSQAEMGETLSKNRSQAMDWDEPLWVLVYQDGPSKSKARPPLAQPEYTMGEMAAQIQYLTGQYATKCTNFQNVCNRLSEETKISVKNKESIFSQYNLTLENDGKKCTLSESVESDGVKEKGVGKNERLIGDIFKKFPSNLTKSTKKTKAKIVRTGDGKYIQFDSRYLSEITDIFKSKVAPFLKALPAEDKKPQLDSRTECEHLKTQNTDSIKKTLENKIISLVSFSSIAISLLPSCGATTSTGKAIWFTLSFTNPSADSIEVYVEGESRVIPKSDFLSLLASRLRRLSPESFVIETQNSMKIEICAVTQLNDTEMTFLRKGLYEKFANYPSVEKVVTKPKEPAEKPVELAVEGEQKLQDTAPIETVHPLQAFLDFFDAGINADHFFSPDQTKSKKKKTISVCLLPGASSINLQTLGLQPVSTKKVLSVFACPELYQNAFKDNEIGELNSFERKCWQALSTQYDLIFKITEPDPKTLYLTVNKQWLALLGVKGYAFHYFKEFIQQKIKHGIECFQDGSDDQPIVLMPKSKPAQIMPSSIFSQTNQDKLLAHLYSTEISKTFKEKIDYHVRLCCDTTPAKRVLHIFSIIHLFSLSDAYSKKQKCTIRAIRNKFRHEGNFQVLCKLFPSFSNYSIPDQTNLILNMIQTEIEQCSQQDHAKSERIEDLWSRFNDLVRDAEGEIEEIIVLAQFIRNHPDYVPRSKKALQGSPYASFMASCAIYFGHHPENLQSETEGNYGVSFQTGIESLRSELQALRKQASSPQFTVR